MYFLPEIRGLGFAKKILEQAFEFSKQHDYKACYLETTKTLWQAINLYEKLGFKLHIILQVSLKILGAVLSLLTMGCGIFGAVPSKIQSTVFTTV